MSWISKSNSLVLAIICILISTSVSGQHGLTRHLVFEGDYSGLPAQTHNDGPEFGSSIAIDGDWMVIGAPGIMIEGDGGQVDKQQGGIYIYAREGDTWEFSRRIVGFNLGDAPRCGAAVAMKLPWLVYGCPGGSVPSNLGSEHGRIVIFKLQDDGETWQLTDSFLGEATGARCGSALDISDPSPAGTMYLASGCPFFSFGTGLHHMGLAQVHSYDATSQSWSAATNITASDADSNHHFGDSVSVDLQCAGSLCLRRLAVGAPLRPHGIAFWAGSVYLFGGASWTETDNFTHINPESFNQTLFGTSVELKGSQLLIGVPGARTFDFPDPPGIGAVYRYQRVEQDWSLQEIGSPENVGGNPPGGQYDMRFGHAVAFGFDNWIAAAAPQADGSFQGSKVAQHVGVVELRRGDFGSHDVSSFQGELRPNSRDINHTVEGKFGTTIAFGSDRWLAVGYPWAKPPDGPDARQGQVWMYAVPDSLFADCFEQ